MSVIYIKYTYIGYCARVAISWAWDLSVGIDMEFLGILEKEL